MTSERGYSITLPGRDAKLKPPKHFPHLWGTKSMVPGVDGKKGETPGDGSEILLNQMKSLQQLVISSRAKEI